ncbi:hypothetical protein EI998_07175 [Streptococcus suis]|uniref:Uncharacterized protein n=1 Tax=Streptococcus suis TaxID=1307 RepID=A0A426TD69_STRSU|nr:hypothetical protein EI998_07175 [Streptococcus suis]
MDVSLGSLAVVRVNISAQWLIGGFVRVLRSEPALTNDMNCVRSISNLQRFPEPWSCAGEGVKRSGNRPF